MTDMQFGAGLERIRARRRLSLEVILIAVALALVINIFSTCFLNVLDPGCENREFWFVWTWISGVALCVATGSAVLYILRKKETETTNVALTVPIYVDRYKGEVSFLYHERYEPAKHLHRLFSGVEKDLAARFMAAWPGPNPLKDKDFGPGHFCWDAIAGLVQACIILLLKNYGERSLTHAAQFYAEFRWLAGHIRTRKLYRNEWPSRVQSNEFLAATGLQKIIVPESSRLFLSIPKHVTGAKAGTQELTLMTDYGRFTFSIARYWTLLRHHDTAAAEFPASNSDRLCFLRIPIDLKIDFGGIHFSSAARQKMTYHYFWFQKLAENAQQWMDWGRYLRGRKESPHDV